VRELVVDCRTPHVNDRVCVTGLRSNGPAGAGFEKRSHDPLRVLVVDPPCDFYDGRVGIHLIVAGGRNDWNLIRSKNGDEDDLRRMLLEEIRQHVNPFPIALGVCQRFHEEQDRAAPRHDLRLVRHRFPRALTNAEVKGAVLVADALTFQLLAESLLEYRAGRVGWDGLTLLSAARRPRG
jgi:hypothetical protein